MSDSDHAEKRHFVRMRVDTIVTYHNKGESEPIYHGTSHNLSATGLYMTTEHTPDIGSEIEIIMNSDGKLLPPFVAEGKVIRCIADEKDPNLFHVSVELSQTN